MNLWPRKIESTFIEIICSKSTNVIVGCIYKHPILPINDFANEFISPLLLKLQKESSKRIFLLGDFNIDFLLVLLVLTFYYLLYFYLQGSVKHPIICYKKDSSIFISWLTHCYWFLPYLLFNAMACFFYHHSMFNRYHSIRDYHNLVLPAILNYDTSFLWVFAQPYGLQFRSKVITHWIEFSFVLFLLLNTY